MKAESTKQRVKREIAEVIRSMDFVAVHPELQKARLTRTGERLAMIYQQLALAWELLGQRCRHWDGFRRDREGRRICRICGIVREPSQRPKALKSSSAGRARRSAT